MSASLSLSFNLSPSLIYIYLSFSLTLSPLLHSAEIHAQLMRAGVYVVPGSKLYGSDPGWIRLIFSVREEELDEGGRRESFSCTYDDD